MDISRPNYNQHPVTKKYFDDNGFKLIVPQTVAGVKTFQLQHQNSRMMQTDEAVTRKRYD